MADVGRLERLVRSGGASQDDLHALFVHYRDLAEATSSVRKQAKPLKRAAFLVDQMAKRELDHPERIPTYLDILERTLPHHPLGAAGIRRTASKLRAQGLKHSQSSSPKQLLSVSRRLPIDTASIGLGDPSHHQDFDLAASMRDGRRLIGSTGYDGWMDSEVRWLEAPEPVLRASEYEQAHGASPTVVITAPAGRLVLGDGLAFNPWDLAGGIDVPPGNYLATLFSFQSGEFDRVIAVFCATKRQPPNEFERSDGLFD